MKLASILLAYVVLTLAMVGGCDWEWVCEYDQCTGQTTWGFQKGFGEGRGTSDIAIGALVVNNGEDVTGVEILKNGAVLGWNANVSASHQSLLAAALTDAMVYDSSTQFLLFFQTTETISLSDTVTTQFVLTSGGKPVSNTTSAGGASSKTDLDLGGPLAQFEFLEQTIGDVTCDKIPTVSEWTAIGMTLLLLVAASIVFFRRRGTETAAA